ncbi:MAG: nucleotidyltransferase family protein [Candidatus Thorarchaeota archaeon]|nr:nucleotidyltransferase family protein [Candidatus Thorarchaeota archaeon]
MKTIDEIKEIIHLHWTELEKKYKVKKMAIFGSYARGEQNKESDLDILVEFSEPVGFLFFHLADYLEEIHGIQVDLVTPDAVKPNRRRFITENLIHL